MLNGAQFHLGVNHLSLVALIIGIGVVTAGFLLKNLPVRRTGLGIFLFSVITFPMAYLSGEAAEEVVEHKAGVTEGLIHNHEEAAEFAIIFIALLAVFTVLALILRKIKKEKYEDKVTGIAVMIAFFTLTVLLRTAHLGGMIRHEEVREIKASEQ